MKEIRESVEWREIRGGLFMEEIKESMEERSENMFKKEKRVLNYVPAIPKRRLL